VQKISDISYDKIESKLSNSSRPTRDLPIQSTKSTSKPKSKKSGSESRSGKARSLDKTESKQSKLNADGSIHTTSTSPTNNRLRYRFRDSWFTDQDYKDLNFKNFLEKPKEDDTGPAKCIPCNTTMVADIGVIDRQLNNA